MAFVSAKKSLLFPAAHRSRKIVAIATIGVPLPFGQQNADMRTPPPWIQPATQVLGRAGFGPGDVRVAQPKQKASPRRGLKWEVSFEQRYGDKNAAAP
jgi:hypothetical protein